MKNLLKFSVLAIALLWGGARVQAQQDVLVSQYMFNHLLLNPAYAGSKPYISSTLLHRSQWVGWKGAPLTQIATIHGPLPDRRNALGFTVSNDHLGITNQTDLFLNYAYRINFDKYTSLAFGLKGGLSWYQAKFSDLVYWDQGDQVYQGGTQMNLLPNFGVGAYFQNQNFYAGLSVPRILSYDPRELFSIGKDFTSLPKVRRHYYLTSGVAIPLNDNLVLKPSFLLRYVPGVSVQADLNLNLLINKILWVGGSYRTGDSFVGMVEFQATRKFRIGYAFDYTLTDVANYSSNTHEFMIAYDFGYDIMKMKTPRYF